jgi:hypothetical protein
MTTKTLLSKCLLAAMVLVPPGSAAWGQQYAAPDQMTAAPPVAAVVPQQAVAYSADQLQQLVAPIALYPDPLLAQMLPASTYPLDLVSAAQWLAANPSPGEQALAALPWEPPIIALMHYPPVLQFMSQNLAWTQALGVAFINQQTDVMNAVQVMRARALAAGALVNTPQQQIVAADNIISIMPVQPEMVYVPQYDPNQVYIGGGISFGPGFALGLWLNNDCDWYHHWVAVGAGWNHGWRDTDRRYNIEHPVVTRPWAHDPARPMPVPPRFVANQHPVFDEHRGYVAPAPGRPEVRGPARPAEPHPAVRQERPSGPELFNTSQSRAQVEREAQRGNESRGAAPAPSRAPSPPPANAGAARGPSGAGGGAWSGSSGQAQSARGHQSMGH